MSWLDRRRPKKSHPFPPKVEFWKTRSFNERLKDLDRQYGMGTSAVYMEAVRAECERRERE